MMVRKVIGGYDDWDVFMRALPRLDVLLRRGPAYVGDTQGVFVQLRRLGAWGGYQGVFEEFSRRPGRVVFVGNGVESKVGRVEVLIVEIEQPPGAAFYWQLAALYGKRADRDKYAVGSKSL